MHIDSGLHGPIDHLVWIFQKNSSLPIGENIEKLACWVGGELCMGCNPNEY